MFRLIVDRNVSVPIAARSVKNLWKKSNLDDADCSRAGKISSLCCVLLSFYALGKEQYGAAAVKQSREERIGIQRVYVDAELN